LNHSGGLKKDDNIKVLFT